MSLRRIRREDEPLLSEYIQGDPYHKDTTTAVFWYQNYSIVAEDEKGVVIFIRFDAEPPLMRIHMQFCPNTKRVARIMMRDWAEVRQLIEAAGAKGIVFESTSPRLISFCEKAYGFKRMGETNDFRMYLVEAVRV